ncbi:hypothetical protein AMAG_01769 [Allomyces macrogynus ATCC 38327]|uniref:Uncharacterized protein n=1 Tax=Allomyces macrogynus (strain ATCC 38327) TaxID=578462 RepID=A0A0L0RZR5_ALLM3|nr:hypothetical protein AMAG_01769 [Allomyces macrogynus ATCC 38327]|eukprot:KNE55912.1 hypothetical protein AMAG_01769 [Allomyces macrogynus ATCC 38327]
MGALQLDVTGLSTLDKVTAALNTKTITGKDNERDTLRQAVTNYCSYHLLCELNRTPVSEDEVLDLVDKAESGQFDDWFQVAEALTSARSEVWAFRYYHEFLRAQGLYNERIGCKFTPAEDDLLHQAVHIHGPDQWTAVAELLGKRDAKQCLQRWKAQDLAIRRGRFTRDEDAALRAAVTQCGEKWSDVARLVLGRTDMQCRERY